MYANEGEDKNVCKHVRE